jgi:hypothetical protein
MFKTVTCLNISIKCDVKECFCVTVSNIELVNGEPCVPCRLSNCVTKKSVLAEESI